MVSCAHYFLADAFIEFYNSNISENHQEVSRSVFIIKGQEMGEMINIHETSRLYEELIAALIHASGNLRVYSSGSDHEKGAREIFGTVNEIVESFHTDNVGALS